MNALAIHLYLTIRYINLSFNYFGNFYRIIDYCESAFINVYEADNIEKECLVKLNNYPFDKLKNRLKTSSDA